MTFCVCWPECEHKCQWRDQDSKGRTKSKAIHLKTKTKAVTLKTKTNALGLNSQDQDSTLKTKTTQDSNVISLQDQWAEQWRLKLKS